MDVKIAFGRQVTVCVAIVAWLSVSGTAFAKSYRQAGAASARLAIACVLKLEIKSDQGYYKAEYQPNWYEVSVPPNAMPEYNKYIPDELLQAARDKISSDSISCDPIGKRQFEKFVRTPIHDVKKYFGSADKYIYHEFEFSRPSIFKDMIIVSAFVNFYKVSPSGFLESGKPCGGKQLWEAFAKFWAFRRVHGQWWFAGSMLAEIGYMGHLPMCEPAAVR